MVARQNEIVITTPTAQIRKKIKKNIAEHKGIDFLFWVIMVDVVILKVIDLICIDRWFKNYFNITFTVYRVFTKCTTEIVGVIP